MNKIAQIYQHGQQVWLDNLSSELIHSGKLARMIHEDKITGVTSNPSIFYKSIATDKSYSQELERLRQSKFSSEERYETLVIPDIKNACDALMSTYQHTNKSGGYVSFELAPYLANDVEGSIYHAKRLWNFIDKPNLMIKVPATKAGLLVLTELIALGINVNITLLFSLGQVHSTWTAYILGLEKRLAQGLPIDNVMAVASLFLSRVDTLLDPKLPEHLQGKIALAIAKKAYFDYSKIFAGERFGRLLAHKANRQQLLWASTGAKNPNYSDVMYVDNLIADETINTMPDATIDAFKDHGSFDKCLKATDDDELAKTNSILNEVASLGVDLNRIGEQLQVDGLKIFDESFNKLMELVK